ncbi:MAG TPA: ArsR family transcriptional regulator [Thermomicrobiales bacterium]|nr:ArsR family transcriptional regulator [Thermomicrobiales bacterium]
MVTTRWDERFLASTRGQVAALLRRGSQTVDELAGALGLTDNAIRAHLTALERDGLVKQGEPRRGGGKPAFTYELTAEAERLFPKAYGLLLTQLLKTLAERLPPAALDDVLRAVGHEVAADQRIGNGDLRDRVEQARTLLTNLGGVVDVEESADGFVLQGASCPLCAAVEGSPEACLIAEALLADVIGVEVCQACDLGPPPRCRFEVRNPAS